MQTGMALADLYRAYRNAKVEAFYENTHFHALAFALYEQNLHRNLMRLGRILRGKEWSTDAAFIGSYAYLPKSVAIDQSTRAGAHFVDLDPLAQWSGAKLSSKASIDYRLVIRPTVDYMVVNALWIAHVGHLFDAVLDQRLSYGNRLRRRRGFAGEPGELNTEAHGLFVPYFSAYRDWRGNGLRAMRECLDKSDDAIAITMDVERFYHRVNPDFLLRSGFLQPFGIAPTEEQRTFTERLLESMRLWYARTPDAATFPAGAIPVGLSASKVIANVVLAELDRAFVKVAQPVYYGRYVDDLFVVLRAKERAASVSDVSTWLAELLPSMLSTKEGKHGKGFLRLRLTYASDSDLRFTHAKQKVFALSGDYGLDLLAQIKEQIRRQSSEHRLLPLLPASNRKLLAQALLATPDATLEPDALRKADTVSIRRLGFSLLLRDAETYQRDLRNADWRKRRQTFLQVALRHLITPQGFADYFSYILRVFGLIIASAEYKVAHKFLDRFAQVVELLRQVADRQETSSQFASAVESYARGFYQIALQAAGVRRFRFSNQFAGVVRRLVSFGPALSLARSPNTLRRLAVSLLYRDLGRRPYREVWFAGTGMPPFAAPAVPKDISVRKVLRLAGIRQFRKAVTQADRSLQKPFWPAVSFPTRPFTLPEITLAAPSVLDDLTLFRRVLLALRGARLHAGFDCVFKRADQGTAELVVPNPKRDRVLVAVTSVETSDSQWKRAAQGTPDTSLERYDAIRTVINRILNEKDRVHYIALPEASIPRQWAYGIAHKLALNGISLIAGLEYSVHGRVVRNDALVSLSTRAPGYQTHIYWRQPKMAPAHKEASELAKLRMRLFTPKSLRRCRPIYVHGGFCFGVLICSDLTNVEHRKHFQGRIDALFVLEWNPDTHTFGYLVESASHDLHATVIQINNRTYGDSRVRSPFRVDHMRDVVRVKGGLADYYVIASISIEDLRAFQRKPKWDNKDMFKPCPIGYTMSDYRRRGK